MSCSAKERAAKTFDVCSPIGQLRGSIPSCITSTSSNIYCVKGGCLVSSPLSFAQSRREGENSSTPPPPLLSFSKATLFYEDFAAFKKKLTTSTDERAEEKKKILSLEEELLAERFRVSTDVDISGVRAVAVSSSPSVNVNSDISNSNSNSNTQWWLIIKRPGQTLLWKEREEFSSSSSSTCQLYDLFGQVLLSEMKKFNISAPMDLQVVEINWKDHTSLPTTIFWKFSFVSSGNVYVCSFSSSSSSSSSSSFVSDINITPITTSGLSGKLEFGTPDFIMQEEFSRYSGVWWSPNRKMVCFSGCDIADTPQAQLLRPDGSIEQMPFPRVGQDNATCSIFVAHCPCNDNESKHKQQQKQQQQQQQQQQQKSQVLEAEEKYFHDGKNDVSFGQIKTLPFVALLAAFPWIEYIVRMYWLSNAEFAVAVLSRDQERYALVKVPVSSLLALRSRNDEQENSLLMSTPDMSLTPKANLLKEHNNNNSNSSSSSNAQPSAATPTSSASSSSPPRWFDATSEQERLRLLLSEMKNSNQAPQSQSQSESQQEQILSLIRSFAILRESHIPSAWVDINDETHFFSRANEKSKSNIACVAQDIAPSTKNGFFHVFVQEKIQQNNNNNNDNNCIPSWKQVSSSSLLPRGILGNSTSVTKDKEGNPWLIAKAFLHNAYMTSIVAIPLADDFSECPSSPPRPPPPQGSRTMCVLSKPDEDAVGFVVVGGSTSSSDAPSSSPVTPAPSSSSSLIYHSMQLDSADRKIQTRQVLDLADFLSASSSSSSSLSSTAAMASPPVSRPVQFVESQETEQTKSPTTASSKKELPLRPKMNFFEVPIPGHADHEEKLQAMIMYPDDDGDCTETTQENEKEKEKQKEGLPLFIFVYGGPHVAYCTLTTISCNVIVECMRRLGFAVLVVDSRMATRHSLSVNSDGKRKMGSFEIEDVLAAVDHVLLLAGEADSDDNDDDEERTPDVKFVKKRNQTKKIDPKRIGIHGFSYGGYVSLLALGLSDRFKVAVAGAPVTDWRLYDTGYTERYMGLLPRDAKAYDDSTAWKLAKNFPDEWNRCFILHGFLDENVHMTHTQKMIEALVKECKPFNLLAYPGERHGIRKTKESAKHHGVMTIRAMLEFL